MFDPPSNLPAMSHAAKVILVTGGSSGLGKAICARLAAEGHIVYGTSRKAQPELSNGVKALGIPLPLRGGEGSVRGLQFRRIFQRFNRLSLVRFRIEP